MYYSISIKISLKEEYNFFETKYVQYNIGFRINKLY